MIRDFVFLVLFLSLFVKKCHFTVISPKISVEQFYVSQSTLNASCFILEMSATINVAYRDRDGAVHSVDGYIDSSRFQNQSMKVKGECAMAKESMVIPWAPLYKAAENISEYSGTLELRVENITGKQYKIEWVKLTLPLIQYNDTLELLSDKIDILVNMGSYFSCSDSFSFTLQSKNGSTAKISTTDFKWMSFRTPNSIPFYGSYQPCFKDAISNNIVPLVVGGVLAVMVLIVIVTYLIGRRRHRPNYQTI